MRALVTGANGFIGSNLCRVLIERGYEVVAFVLPGTNEKNLEGTKVRIIHGDILEPKSLKNAMSGVDTVFHLAALVTDWGSRELFMRVNVQGTRNVLDAAVGAKAKRFVYMSSLAIHKFKGWNGADENAPRENFRYPYSASKIAAEDLCNRYFREGKIETVIVRPGFVIIGPGDVMFFYRIAQVLEQHKPYGTINGGRAKFCYSYVENLVDGMVFVAESGKSAGETYIISDGILTWKAFNEAVSHALGVKNPTASIPYRVAYPLVAVMEQTYKLFGSKNPPPLTRYRISVQARDLSFVSNKIEKLGYRPKVSLDEGLRRTVEWYKQQKRVAQI
jgi:nucleoside-diphosphate-sugar epimerase